MNADSEVGTDVVREMQHVLVIGASGFLGNHVGALFVGYFGLEDSACAFTELQLFGTWVFITKGERA